MIVADGIDVGVYSGSVLSENDRTPSATKPRRTRDSSLPEV